VRDDGCSREDATCALGRPLLLPKLRIEILRTVFQPLPVSMEDSIGRLGETLRLSMVICDCRERDVCCTGIRVWCEDVSAGGEVQELRLERLSQIPFTVMIAASFRGGY
jgi:hypothetical protein